LTFDHARARIGPHYQPKIPQVVNKDVYFQLSGVSASSILKVIEPPRKGAKRSMFHKAISHKFCSCALETSIRKRLRSNLR